jgi:hypothetical protein
LLGAFAIIIIEVVGAAEEVEVDDDEEEVGTQNFSNLRMIVFVSTSRTVKLPSE